MPKFSLKLVASTALLATGLVAYTPGFWSSGAWAQQTQRQWEPRIVVTDLQNASVFSNRFKDPRAAYDARVSCASRIEQLLGDVTLPDMVRATEILKSMIESLQGDRKDVSAVQTQLLELAEKMDSSQKAMLTIQRVHRAMCTSGKYARAKAENRDIRGARRD
jgi:hypothetical protein